MTKPKLFASWTPEKQEEWREKKRARDRKYTAANSEKIAEKNRKYRQLQREMRDAAKTLAMMHSIQQITETNGKA